MPVCCVALGQTLRAVDFGIKADGKTDDGPAIVAMLCAAKSIKGPVTLLFPLNKTIYVKKLPDRYVFSFNNVNHIILDGGGSTFLLDSYVRFLDLKNSSDVKIRRLNVDFSPLPFVDGKVIEKSSTGLWIEVKLKNEEEIKRVIGTPVFEGKGKSQRFFSMLWNKGAYGNVSKHYWTTRTERGKQKGTVRVYTNKEFQKFDEINSGKTHISIPVPGIAHLFGPGACFSIRESKNIQFEDVELWSAPWFGFHVLCNKGNVTFKRVNIRPKPGSNRLMSIWRDGFHVKGNQGSLLWEDCIISGMNDDAFNISTHSREIEKIISPTCFILRQRYPMEPIPWLTNNLMIAANFESRSLRGSAVVTKIESEVCTTNYGQPVAPLLTIEIDHPIPGIKKGDLIWQPVTTNPDTIIRRCNIETSCRLQSPVTLEDCDITGFIWLYCEEIEGPFPSNVKIINCRLHRGRGNKTKALIVSGWPKSGSSSKENIPPRAIHDISIIDNKIYGGFVLGGVENVTIKNNHFLEEGAAIVIRGNHNVKSRKNFNNKNEKLKLK